MIFGTSKIAYRLTLQKDEVMKLPKGYREVQVLSGTAWISIEKKDIILKSGEKVTLPSSKELAVISALSKGPALLEVQAETTKVTPQQLVVNLHG